MSRLHDSLPPHPVAIPRELEAAWTWMEAQGHGGGDSRPHLTAYPGSRVLGPVFGLVSLEGWFDADSEAAQRLRPIGEAGGDGSILALWEDDGGVTRAVVLGSEGGAHQVAGSAVELLTLLAIGYVEITEIELGLPPDDEHAVEAHTDFRSWVGATFAVEVPEEWPAAEDDVFTAWVRRELGEAGPQPAPVPSSTTEVAGDLEVVLAALGTPDGSPQVRALADLLDVPLVDGGLRKAARALRAREVEVEFERGTLTTVFLQDHPIGPLLAGLPPAARTDDVLALLGEPEQRRDGYLRYVVRERFLHLSIDGDGEIGMITTWVDETRS
ncbi:hypothetical protein [Nocardioides hwasunensis]|uniref:Uncharacterized protein n=1 Tax=Nocardioides hwasunensis TaxID=397258 RepID=A0ABR8MG33_9ACTN|nr:hypothetical protein [Nocardioides hwasunensis]MBD3915042.1 hypothetical protein [Nocardioides hwasunensis]